MTKEELKQKAEEYANGKGHEHYNYLFEEHAGSPADFARLCFQDGVEFGYNKANEWHYVKDGDLPKEYDKPYLCKVYSHFEVGYFTAYKDQPWHFDEYYLDNEDVIAWKEIVLPELKESV